MNGTDGKPFKTRAGGVMKLFDLIAMATAEAEKRLAEQGIGADYSADERAEIARKVGIATIKFADLSNYRLTDYIFDLERFSRFEGKTGPYLQYAAVRIQSILRKRGGRGPRDRRTRRSVRRKSARWSCNCSRCPTRWPARGGQARAQYPVRLRLHPGAALQPLLCRASHPVRIGRGDPRPRGWAFAS